MSLETIGAIVAITGGLTSIGQAVFGGGRGISIPTLPKIPTPDYESLQAQITANQGITEEARQAAIQNLNAYNNGALSPTYRAMYEDY